jgi:CrcB protein
VSSPRADELAVVAVGGVLGALARASISTALPHHDPASWPWATFVTNLVGCLLLGAVLAWVDARSAGWRSTHPRRARLARPLLASGVLGGFTTFSTFSVESYLLVRHGAPAAGLLYAVASAVLGVALVLLGRRLGAALLGPVALDLAQDETL